MNFLAHFYLSGDSPSIVVGNFIGDFVKGKQIENYDETIARGILLHREIDFYTDNHSIVLESKDKLRERYRHYAGVVTDIFYDHFLAANWEEYSELSLKQFADQSYATVLKRKSILPARASFMLPYMIRDNWLVNYAKVEGIRRACQGVAKRTKFKSNMEFAAEDLKKDYNAFQDDFQRFFPEIIDHVENYKKEVL